MFLDRLRQAWADSGSLLCVGLDPVPEWFPESLGRSGENIRDFNRAIIEATSDLACCYKPNLGFYMPCGHDGIDALASLRDDVPAHIPILLDCKVGDIDTTTTAYARAYFDAWRFDAVTAHAYLGRDSLQPLLGYRDRGVFVLAKTSNPGSGMLQDRLIASPDGEGEPVSSLIARQAMEWNEHGNVGLVVGATYPGQLETIRAIVNDMPILVPGVGAQQGDLEAAVQAGVDAQHAGILVNASRAISYASTGADFKDAARAAAQRLRDQINAARTPAGTSPRSA